MKNIIYFLLLAGLSAYANTQVFISNTMDIKLDKDTKYEKIFLGTYTDFMNNAKDIVNSDMLKIGLVNTGLATLNTAANNGRFKNLDAGGGLVGAGAILALSLGIAIFGNDYEDKSITDKRYVYTALATNSKGEKTTIYGFVISPNELSLEKVKQLVKDKR